MTGWLLVCYTAGFVASQFEPGIWYQQLNKPWLTPPDFVFPVIWPVLYTLMGVAIWLVRWAKTHTWHLRAVWLFILQLVLNALWSYLFFELHEVGWAFVEIILLLATIILVIIVFLNIRLLAAILMIPYGLWIAYASYLVGYILIYK